MIFIIPYLKVTELGEDTRTELVPVLLFNQYFDLG